MSGAGRHGFTLLEVLMAMVIGSMVVAGGFGLVTMTSRLDRGFAARLEGTMEIGFVQRTIARSMQSIVVAPEGYDPGVAARAAAEEKELMELYATSEDRDAFFNEMREFNVGEAIDPEIAPEDDEELVALKRSIQTQIAPARFRMGHLSKEGEWEYRDEDAGKGVRRLEVLLVRAPYGDQARGAPVRGAFDIVPTPSGKGERWRLQWTPIVPAGKPMILLEDLILAEWSTTDSRGQYDDFAAYVEADLPWALRTILWMEDGTRVDWMFDLGAATSTVAPL